MSNIKVTVEKVRIEGNGAIILTGPSCSGKGEVSKHLCKILSLSNDMHLSMGDILRRTIDKAKNDLQFRDKLSSDYNISDHISIFDLNSNKAAIVEKAKEYIDDLKVYYEKQEGNISQLDWLEFCVNKGLLIPDEWGEKIIGALIESSKELQSGIFILDGYPRTTESARYLLTILNRHNIPVIKVVHLSITKEEMKRRALYRGRADDTMEGLERRYQFYTDKVQPSIEFLKQSLGNEKIVLIDASQPVFDNENRLNVGASIKNVMLSVIESLSLPKFLADI